eukprot:7644043-Pyramimonas_sp.AAC.1
MEIPHDVRANSTDLRKNNQNRIDFLSSMRNKALAPLTKFNNDPEKWYDYVVFLNDVLFCAKDIK